MALIKDGSIVDDPWTPVADDAPIPESGAAIVSLNRWLGDIDALKARSAPLGLRLEAGESPEEIADEARHFDVIILNFPAFKDGRAYSYARMLRQTFGYKNELRATGEVLRSQLLFMHRVGFDAFEVDDRITPAVLAHELSRLTEKYQPSADNGETIIDKRQKR
jgi:uncharacterized protein (DUF934 family)